jgi:hypothetical protein
MTTIEKLLEAQTKIKEAITLNQEVLDEFKPLDPVFASTENDLEFPDGKDKSLLISPIRTDLFDIRDHLIRSSLCINAVNLLIKRLNKPI